MAIYDLSNDKKLTSELRGYDYIYLQDTGKSTNNPNTYGQVDRDFTFTLKDQNSHVLPSRGFLEIRCKLMKVNGTNDGYDPLTGVDWATAAQSRVAIAANVCNILKRKTLRIAGVTIEDTPNHAGPLLNAETLIHSTEQFNKTVGSNMYAMYSTTEDMNLDATMKFDDAYQKRSPLGMRSALANQSKDLTFYVPLNLIFNYLAHNDKLMTNLGMEFNFEIAKDNEICFRESVAPALHLNWVGHGMRVLIPRVTLSEAPLAKFLKQIHGKGTFEAHYEDSQVSRSEYASGSGGFDWVVPTRSRTRIKRCIVFAQHKDRVETQVEDFSRFDPIDLTKISIDLNGVKVPQRDLEISFAPGRQKWHEAYQRYLSMNRAYEDPLGSGFTTQGLLSYQDWKLYPMYCFDLQDTVDQDSIVATQANTISVNIERTSGGKDFYLYCLVYYDKAVSLDMHNGIVSEVAVMS